MTAGEQNLEALLADLKPELMDGEYVFCSFPGAIYGDHVYLRPVAAVVEREGLTLVIPRAVADAHELDYTTVLSGISLTVHSSLEAVGLTAAVSSRLADLGISANVLAGCFHDHIFVQSHHAGRALRALAE